jgi:hypothetical protein
MRPILPVVYSRSSGQLAILHGWDDQGREPIEIKLDSADWFAWLAVEQSFRFSYWQAGGASVNFTVRPEKRGERTYWQGWKTIGGQTLKKYIAPSAKLNKTKLDKVGDWFYQQVEARTEAKVELKLYAAVVDLTWLVEQLLGQCQNPALAERVQQELKRIKQSVGN